MASPLFVFLPLNLTRNHLVALSRAFQRPVCAHLPEPLSSSHIHQSGQHGPVRQGKDPYRRCLRIWHAYKLLDSDSLENGDHLRHWAAHLASVGEESEQQGRVLKELDLRMLFMEEPPPRPRP